MEEAGREREGGMAGEREREGGRDGKGGEGGKEEWVRG